MNKILRSIGSLFIVFALPLFSAIQAQELQMALPDKQITFSEKGGCINQVLLTEYKEDLKADNPVKLFGGYKNCKFLGSRVGSTDLRELPASIVQQDQRWITEQRSNGMLIRKTFAPDSFDVEIVNETASVVTSTFGLELGAESENQKSSGIFTMHPMQYQGISYVLDDSLESEQLPFDSAPAPEELLKLSGFAPLWVGHTNHYFLAALMPKNAQRAGILAITRTGFNIQKDANSVADQTVYEAWYDFPVTLEPGKSVSFNFDIYLGPKLKDRLAVFEKQKLDLAIDYGFFRVVALPMFTAMKFLTKWMGNWGWAIIVLTLAIKLVFYPLTVKAYLSGKKMQELQPEMNALKEKYKDDKQKQQQETMALMSSKGVNPVSGCLPLLPQIPVFFGLNAVLAQTFELRQAPFIGWIQDLSTRDPLYISPVIMAGLMILQQRITPMPASLDPAQAKMMKWMPVIFAAFLVIYPSGLVLYSIVNIVVSMLMQWFMIKRHQ